MSPAVNFASLHQYRVLNLTLENVLHAKGDREEKNSKLWKWVQKASGDEYHQNCWELSRKQRFGGSLGKSSSSNLVDFPSPDWIRLLTTALLTSYWK